MSTHSDLLLSKPENWWRDPALRERLCRLQSFDYWLARLERDRALFDASDGLGQDEQGRAYVALLRERTEQARGPRDAVVDTSPLVLGRRKRQKTVRAFSKAIPDEIEEYRGLLTMWGLLTHSDLSDEFKMQELLERFER